DPELGVDDVLHRLGDLVLGQGGGAAAEVDLGQVGVVAHDGSSCAVGWVGAAASRAAPPPAWLVASFQAIQASRAHLTRAGNFATPAKAMPSPNTSSSGSTLPRPCISPGKAAWTTAASRTGRPLRSPGSTEVDAWLMEQPSAAYDTSATTASVPSPSRCTRRVTSSPQLGLTWCTSASKGSRSPALSGFL